MVNGVSSITANWYLNPFLAPAELSCSAPAAKTVDPWANKPLCKGVNDRNPNCCCDGYSIEAVLDVAYEEGLNNNPEVKRLEQYPCLTCSELDSIADQLSSLIPEKSDAELEAERSKDLQAIADFANALEQADEEGRPWGRNAGAFPFHSK